MDNEGSVDRYVLGGEEKASDARSSEPARTEAYLVVRWRERRRRATKQMDV
jgi:hypothetical protein